MGRRGHTEGPDETNLCVCEEEKKRACEPCCRRGPRASSDTFRRNDCVMAAIKGLSIIVASVMDDVIRV